MSILIDFVNFLIKSLVNIANVLFSILPDSPFKNLNSNLDSTFLGYINWVLPISEIIEISVLWVASIAIYYTVSNILRVIKSIE